MQNADSTHAATNFYIKACFRAHDSKIVRVHDEYVIIVGKCESKSTVIIQ